MRSQLGSSACLVAVVAVFSLALFQPGLAYAQPNILFFEFETDEQLTVDPFGGVISSGGLDGAGFGVTQGNSALVLDNVTQPGGFTLINSDYNGFSTGEGLNNYNAAASAAALLNSNPGTLSFDLGYDASGVFADAFIQIGVVINSDEGFNNSTVFGPLLGGNVGPTGDFPTLGSAGASGATLTVLDPSDFAAGDFLGLIRVEIPTGPGALLPFGDGGDGSLDFIQLGFGYNGGWPGFLDLSLDNVGWSVVPEPTSAAIVAIGLASLGLRRTSRRTRRTR